jgi:hypothetical protein
MTVKDKLLDLLQDVSEQEEIFVASLSEAERSLPGQAHNWSTRDVWAHIVEWTVITGRKIGPPEINDPAPLYEGELQEINEVIFQRLKDRSWSEIENQRQEGNRLVRDNIMTLSEEQINNPEAFPWLEKRPVWRHVGHNVYYHPLHHMAELYVEKNDYLLAERLMTEATQGILSLTDEPDTLASLPYNLACFFAINGRSDQAIEQLEQVLPSRPDLMEWSKEDTDLDSIRQDSRYLTLISD